MNGKIKFHKPNGPAFYQGELWLACDGSGLKCWIDRVEKYGDGKFDYIIHYIYLDGETSSKDAWNFQVRYYHSADKK